MVCVRVRPFFGSWLHVDKNNVHESAWSWWIINSNKHILEDHDEFLVLAKDEASAVEAFPDGSSVVFVVVYGIMDDDDDNNNNDNDNGGGHNG